ncbi:MAG: hypothetical protein SNJ55_00910 [Chloroherpetonaceae bacterium]
MFFRLAFFALFLPALCKAQTLSNTSFERFLNTYFWKGNYFSSHQLGVWTLTANNNFQSTLINLSERALRDENEFSFILSRPFYARSQLHLEGSNYFLSDNRSLFRNSAVSNRVALGVSSRPSDWSVLEANGGFKAERQVNQFNSGFIYALRGELLGYQFSNFELSSRVNLSQEFLEPRRNKDKGIILSLNQKYNRAELLLSGGMSEERRDYFSNVLASQEPTTVVERRIEQNFYTIDSLSYRTFSNLTTRAKVELRRRVIIRENSQQFSDLTNAVYDNEIEQLRLFTDAGVMFESSSFQTFAGVLFQQQSESYRPINAFSGNPIAITREQFRNNSFQVATLYLSSIWRHFNAVGDTVHYFFVSAQMRGFRYDTPDTTNTDDRDEVSYALTISDSLRLNRYFGLRLVGSFATTNNVFISRERSANNTKNYILRFSPTTVWRVPKKIESVNEFGVLANYTVYDFEIGSQTRSFSFRQFSFLDSTQFFLNETITLKFLYEQRLYERGELFWNNFAERPLSRFNDRSLSFEIEARYASLVSSFGIRIFARSQSNFQTRPKTDEVEIIELPLPNLLYIGPTARLSYRPSQSVEFETSGWYQVERLGSQTVQIFPNFHLSVKALF